MRSRSWTDAQLAEAVARSTTWGQVARALDLKSDGGSGYYKIRSVAEELGLDTSHFLGRSWSKDSGTGRDREKQRASARRWYENNKHVHIDRIRARQLQNAQRLRAVKNVPCADCGQRFPPVCMDFDHREGDNKAGNVAVVMRQWSWRRLLTEIEKCDIVCANCHRLRTARRAGWHGSQFVTDVADLASPS